MVLEGLTLDVAARPGRQICARRSSTQAPSVYTDLTIKENLRYVVGAPRERVAEVVELAGRGVTLLISSHVMGLSPCSRSSTRCSGWRSAC